MHQQDLGIFANIFFANISFANILFANILFANILFANISFANILFANILFANILFAKKMPETDWISRRGPFEKAIDTTAISSLFGPLHPAIQDHKRNICFKEVSKAGGC